MGTQFATGNAVFSDRLAVTVYFPKAQANWIYSAFLGALVELADPKTWQTVGETTSDEAALLFKDIFDGIQPMLYTIGQIMAHGAPVMADSAWLACDGTLYSADDEPDLYAAIGTTYNQGGESAGYFRVPDLSGRTLAGVDTSGRLPAWGSALGGAGGEKDHTLTSGEMPAHNHSTGNSLTGAAVMPGEGPVLIPNPIPASTGSAGGDGAHNNVQPTMTVYFYILARM